MGKSVVYVEQAQEKGQDRASALQVGDADVLLLADGAGGISGGAEAAEKTIQLMKDHFLCKGVPEEYISLEEELRQIDISLFEDSAAGECTVIIAVIQSNHIIGASVGDSLCWTFNQMFDYELTRLQHKKPLLGSGNAIPIGFGPFEIDCFLVMASDGLFGYTTIENIKATLKDPLEQIPTCLINLVRLRSGALNDDVSIIVYQN